MSYNFTKIMKLLLSRILSNHNYNVLFKTKDSNCYKQNPAYTT